MALETITFHHLDLERLSIHIPQTMSYITHEDGVALEQNEAVDPGVQWPDLDRLLLKFWDSRLIRPTIVSPRMGNGRGTKDWAGNLLPELTKRGIIDLVDGFCIS